MIKRLTERSAFFCCYGISVSLLWIDVRFDVLVTTEQVMEIVGDPRAP